jgi:hypothetical protein
MTHASPSTISVSVPLGAAHKYCAASIAAMLQGERKPRKSRKPTLASVAKQASKVGIEVARYEVKPDGTVVIVTVKPESSEPGNEFRTKENKQ